MQIIFEVIMLSEISKLQKNKKGILHDWLHLYEKINLVKLCKKSMSLALSSL